MPPIVRPREIAALRKAAKAAGEVASLLAAEIESQALGPSAESVEARANGLLAQRRSTAPFKAFTDDDGKRFGFACCVSVNGEVVNGPPIAERTFAVGDVVSVAVATALDGLHGKAARTVVVGGKPTPEQTRLIHASRQWFEDVSRGVLVPKTLGDISRHVQAIAQQAHVVVIPDTGGHGIGKHHQQDVALTNLPDEAEQAFLDSEVWQPGQALVPMPMLALMTNPDDTAAVVETSDGWTLALENPGVATHWAETCWHNPETGQVEVLSAAVE